MKRFVCQNRNNIVCVMSVLAVLICVLAKNRVEAKDEVVVLSLVSAIWMTIVIFINIKKVWKG